MNSLADKWNHEKNRSSYEKKAALEKERYQAEMAKYKS